MAPPPPTTRLLRNTLIPIPTIKPNRPECRPREENHLHDPQRKASLEHPARLVQVIREVVPGLPPVSAKGAQRDIHASAVPVAAVGGCDEAELVDGCDKGAEEEEVDEGDEGGGALGCGVAD